MKNSMRRAMISTVCMLIVAVMSLTGVTYAWFTAGADATVDNITVDVQAATGGIELSGDNGMTWQTKISAGTSAKFDPVSTVGDLAKGTKDMNFFKGEINAENSAQIQTTATNTGYFKKDLHIRNISGSGIKINLKDFEIKAIDGKDSNDANYAMRIALVVKSRYTMPISEDGTPTKTPVSSEHTIKIYEPYSYLHTENAKKNLGAVDGKDSSDALKYKGIHSASQEFVALNDGNIAAELTDGYLTYNASDLTITLANGEYAEISIYVWIEGQDIDCENSISAGAFTFDFVFEKDASYTGN